MARVQIAVCDNPDCEVTGTPEGIDLGNELGPYGWVEIEGSFVGCGPSFEGEFCTPECAQAAFLVMIDRAQDIGP